MQDVATWQVVFTTLVMLHFKHQTQASPGMIVQLAEQEYWFLQMFSAEATIPSLQWSADRDLLLAQMLCKCNQLGSHEVK